MLARRSVLKSGLAAGLVPVLGGAASAQDSERSHDVVLVIATAKGMAENLLAAALYGKLSLDNKAIEAANERIFKDLTGVVGGIPAEEAALYAELTLTPLTDAMTEHRVALVPEQLTPVIPAGSPGTSDELAGVVGDITKDAFGVNDLNVAGLQQAASQLGITSFLIRIGDSIRAGDWALAAQFLRAVLSQLAASVQTVPALEGALGEKAIAAILTGVSARFVPVIGWPILVATILYAIAKHKDRLLAALERAR